MKVGKSGKAGPHAAYIAREGKYQGRLERGEKLEAKEHGNMPAWAQLNPQEFWSAADQFERVNGTTYREMEIALPRELTYEQRADLVRQFVQQEIGNRHAYQWAIHTPLASDGEEQPHVHLMFSERQVDGIDRDPAIYFKRYNSKSPERGGARKGYGPSAGQTLTKTERAAELKELRRRWEAMCNAHLDRAGAWQRIDMRSHAERDTGLEPERKQLPSQWRNSEHRGKVIEFRKARTELSQSREVINREIPNAIAEIIQLDEARKLRDQKLSKSGFKGLINNLREHLTLKKALFKSNEQVAKNVEPAANLEVKSSASLPTKPETENKIEIEQPKPVSSQRLSVQERLQLSAKIAQIHEEAEREFQRSLREAEEEEKAIQKRKDRDMDMDL
ncbi:hypothetical protein GCM10009425_46860 [Pseudomonas asuensis]|uniref:MobA/MobL protein domain-containing protein n=1 Tax=Pseudomonas asuensis TaxID=1825787 RepID=A0ABQ2H337_9PSED|nr:MobA/MobL family protein [Pseudomonas asuensis]GGM30851.1 hypothetical protein GCM10009425_46860 [Pseudomonas asuensis]